MFKLAASKHGLDGLSHLAAKISNLSFDRHCSVLIFIGDNYPDDIIAMVFRLVHCDSRGDKPVDNGINKGIRIPQFDGIPYEQTDRVAMGSPGPWAPFG